jgi:cob(I)alamin adenosyltransferase
MRIYTKTGDRGATSLLYGGRVKKSCLRVEICGILDELNSFLGLGRSLLKGKTIKKLIAHIQKDIYMMCTEIATHTPSVHKLKKRINVQNVKSLESLIDKLEKKNKAKISGFILPGKNTLSAALDVARSIARKVERRAVILRNKGMLKNRYILAYLNRLSDLLYLLARSYEKRKKKKR